MFRKTLPHGFGLIEIMVGLAIGMIATIVMLQTLSVSERQKRTTTGASDAQSNGAVSLFSIERDVKMAGWGLQGSVFAGCTSFFTYNTTAGGAIDSNTTPGSSLVSVLSITDGGTKPDTITIRYYDDPSNQDFRFAIASIANVQAKPEDKFVVSSVKGCNVKDLLVISNGAQCTLAQVSSVDSTAVSISHDTGADYPYNPKATDMTGWPNYDGSSRLQ